MSIPVSVNMIVYNREAYIERALSSIRSQTLKHIQIVIVNDGSTDGTAAYLDDIAQQDDRIHLVHQTNQGITAARNRALSESMGKYIAVLDSDDMAMPQRLEKQLAYMESNSDCVLTGTAYEVINESDEVLRAVCKDANDERLKAQLLGCENPYAHSSVMYDREIANRVGGYHVFQPSEDYDLYLRLSVHGSLGFIPEVMLKYREHASQESSMSMNRAMQCEQMINAILAAKRRGQAMSHAGLKRCRNELHEIRKSQVNRAIRNGEMAFARSLSIALVIQKPWSLECWRLLKWSMLG